MRNGLIFIVIATLVNLLTNGYTFAGEEIASSRNIVKSHTISLKPNDWFEDCHKWEDDDSFKIKLSNSMPLRFSIHYHEKGTNKAIDIMEMEVPQQYEGSLIIQSSEVYCLMLYNENPEDVIFSYDLSAESTEDK